MQDNYSKLSAKSLSVIVPVYIFSNELWQNIDLLDQELSPYFRDYEIIVVNDGGYLDFTKFLSNTKPYLKLYNLPENSGKGQAIKSGFQHAKGDYIIFIDGDMELHPKDIKNFLSLMDIYNADI